MNQTLLTQLKKIALPTLFVGTLLTIFNPAPAAARGFGGGRGYSGRQSYGGGRGYVGGPSYRGGFVYRGAPIVRGPAYRGPVYRGGYDYYGRSYYGGGFALGFGVGPVYGGYYRPGYCEPSGYYDRWGVWRFYPGCAPPPPPVPIYEDPYR